MHAWATASEVAEAVRNGTTSATAVAEAALARIAERDGVLNSFTAVTRERALAKAGTVDAARAHGEAVGPLAGVPFAVKNLFDVTGLATLAGSKINREHAPAKSDATLIARMEAAGAVLVGALNMGEYAYDFTGENVHDGPSRNPHDTGRMTGGSSGGSGGAVAGGLVPISLGSDTNGSIRVPSSLCGLFGLNDLPALSRHLPFVASLDHLGPLALSTRPDARLRCHAGLTPTTLSPPSDRSSRRCPLWSGTRACALVAVDISAGAFPGVFRRRIAPGLGAAHGRVAGGRKGAPRRLRSGAKVQPCICSGCTRARFDPMAPQLIAGTGCRFMV